MTHKQSILYIVDEAAWMFLWTDVSRNIGIIHLNRAGFITGHKKLPRAEAKSMYMSLRKRGAKRSRDTGTESLQGDYEATIAWLLRRI